MRIFASGGLDEREIDRLLAAGAPIDGFGVGTSLVTSEDAPALDCAYKLQEYAGVPRRKRSEGKATYPGRKQVYRYFDAKGKMHYDSLTLETDIQQGRPLLQPVMRGGKRVSSLPTLEQSRQHALSGFQKLPAALSVLAPAPSSYPVQISPALKAVTENT